MNSYTEIFFDVETKKIFADIPDFDPGKLGVSIVSVYKRIIDDNYTEIEGKMESFWEEDFDKMWPVFSDAKRIIGFNTLRFDVAALKPYAPPYFAKLPHFDIYAEIKKVSEHAAGLSAIAKETLDRDKIDDGLNAVYYWEKGDKESLEKLKNYCEDDVLLTKDIYEHALKLGEVSFKDRWNTLRKVKVDFSYPKDETPQSSLF
ncbi:MAG TPA: ribonuclease H-like domain-containing protein [Patescibacteria group bacterium]|nr:ribonuclease H-like domain-containing protein [Patescibacteria group bacterium]